ncbi:glycosyltransferase family 2 protein [Larkinella harenae]
MALIIYTYIGYGVLVWLLVSARDLLTGRKRPIESQPDWPALTVVVPAYNERGYLEEKVQNCLELIYPSHLLHFLFVADGSTDGSMDYLIKQDSVIPNMRVMGGTERLGKVEAMNRAIKQVATPLVVFTDANALLNPEALLKLAKHFQKAGVGAVAGEKRILVYGSEAAAGAGEGFYWKYESFLKRLDSRLYSVVGAAGELLALRTALFTPLEPDILLDDFVLSLQIAAKGYQVVYEPEAYAQERPSESSGEERKRKVRIAAGGFQAIHRLKSLFNIFHFGWLTFQYVSHRVLRWAVAPFCLIIVLVTNGVLVLQQAGALYEQLLLAQTGFYLCALLGYGLEARQLRIKGLFIPYYFAFMNWCALLGYVQYQKGIQSGLWEKAKRAA